MRLADVRLSNSGDVVLAALSGELDLSNAGNIGRAITEAVPNSSRGLIVDLGAVDYLDSAGIRLIYELREKVRTRGQTLLLVIPANSPAKDALRLAGVADHVESAETVDDALRELSAR